MPRSPIAKNQFVQCDDCGKKMRKDNLKRHQMTHKFKCTKCAESFPSEEKLKSHVVAKHSASVESSRFTCRDCGEELTSFYKLQSHRREVHGKRARRSVEDVDLSSFQQYPTLIKELRPVQHFLMDDKAEWTRKRMYNYRLEGLDDSFIEEKLDSIFADLDCTAKINFSFGFILRNSEDPDDFRYYYAADNNPVFLAPVTVSNQQDLEFIKDRIDKESFFENAIQQRPNTKWRFFSLTNVTFFVYLLPDIPLGCTEASFPNSLVKNKLIHLLLRDSEGKAYNDNLCIFRTLALHKYGPSNLATNTNQLLRQFLSKLVWITMKGIFLV